MKVILRENVKDLGTRGDLKEVADGYARNYLLPKNLAFKATEENIKRVEAEKRRIKAKREEERQEARELADQLEDVSITVIKKVAENQVLYGSVTEGEIAEKLEEEGYDIDAKQIIIDDPLKKLGIYDVKIDLHPDVKPVVKVWVVEE